MNDFYSWLNFQSKLDFINISHNKLIERLSKSSNLNFVQQEIDISNIQGDYSYLILEDKFTDSKLIINRLKDNIYLKYVYAITNIASYIPEKTLSLNDIKGFSLMDYIIVPTLETKTYLEKKIPNIKNIYFIPFKISLSKKKHKNKIALCISEKDLSNEYIREYLNFNNIEIFSEENIYISKNHKVKSRLYLYSNINDYSLIIDFYNDFLSSIIQKKSIINKRLYIGKTNDFSNIESLLDLDNSLEEKIELAKEQIKEYSLALENIYSKKYINNVISDFIKKLKDFSYKRNQILSNGNIDYLSYSFKLNQLLEQIPKKYRYLISEQENCDLLKVKLNQILDNKYDGIIIVQKSEFYPDSNFDKNTFLDNILSINSKLNLYREFYFGSSKLKLSERELILFILKKDNNDISNKISIIWEGYQFFHISLAVINREIESKIIESNDYILSIFSHDYYNELGEEYNNYKKIKECINKPLAKNPDFHIRHLLPSGLIPPNEGKYILIFPWEAGEIPKELVEHINNTVDELWCPSDYIKNLHINSGVFKRKIQVIPNGIDLNIFKPKKERYKLNTKKNFKFLFVGGLLFRKGLDILIKAYLTEFSQNDDVTLVIKGLAQNTYYEPNSIKELLGINQSKELSKAEIIFIENNLKNEDLSSLYNTCDIYVHPYRAEGFGMPIFEAMACGTVPIITNYGAGLEYCNDNNAFFICYDYKENKEQNTFIEPSIDDLRKKMRYAYQNKEVVKYKSYNAIKDIKKLSWDNIFFNIDSRLKSLKDLPNYRNNKEFYINYLKSKISDIDDNFDTLRELKTLCDDLLYKEILANEFYIKKDYKKSLDIYTQLFSVTKNKKYLTIIIDLLEILQDYKTSTKLREFI